MNPVSGQKARVDETSSNSRRTALTIKSSSWFWLPPAAVLLLFANGRNAVPLAAWLAPVLLLRFVRKQRLIIGLPVAYLVCVIALRFQFRGALVGPLLYVAVTVYGTFLALPYIIDRLVSRKLDGFAAALVFPAAWAATEYLVSMAAFAGSGTSIAYSQYGDLPLLQILSVTGLWGVTFLIGWFAAVCNWVWEEGLNSRRATVGATVCVTTIAALILLGGARLTLLPPSSQTVRVASLTKKGSPWDPSDDIWERAVYRRTSKKEVDEIRQQLSTWDHKLDRVLNQKATTSEVEEIRGKFNAGNRDLLFRAEREAQAGAEVVFWAERAGQVLKQDEPALIEEGRKLAAKYQAYLGMALATWTPGRKLPLENKLVLIEPSGQIAWEYFKSYPAFEEAEVLIAKDRKVKIADTPYGRLSAIICYDADFPRLPAQAGALGTDIVLDPAGDTPAISPRHTHLASFRAIEQGFNLVRPTDYGLSAAYDYQGRQIAAADYSQARDHVMVAQVPTRGVRTIYSLLGDWFAWACIAAVALLSGKALRARRTTAGKSFVPRRTELGPEHAQAKSLQNRIRPNRNVNSSRD